MRKLLVIITMFVTSYIVYYYLEYRSQGSVKVSLVTEGHPAQGTGNVSIVTFQDLRCSGCRYFYHHTYPKLKKRYIDTGKVRYVVIPLAFLPGSKELAHGALVAQTFGDAYFFAYIEFLYENGHRQNDSTETLLQKAVMASGVPKDAFQKRAALFDSEKGLESNFQQAKQAMGQIATPGIFVEGADLSEASLRDMIRYIDRKVWESGHE
ncbi:MAG: thioredoxin domain-containing protein [Chlamydiota bacterium]